MKRSKQHQRKVPISVRKLFPQVTHAEDATTPIAVTVKEADAADAKSLQASECAMARAAKRQYKADGVIIGIGVSYIIQGDTATRYPTPPTVSREVTSFDRHHDFASGEYKLMAVSPSRRFGHQGGPRKHNRNHQATRVVHTRTVRVRELEAGR